jgi:hypothetical protein
MAQGVGPEFKPPKRKENATSVPLKTREKKMLAGHGGTHLKSQLL